MGKPWWSVWIKVCVLAVVLLVAYGVTKAYVMKMVKPYLLDKDSNKQASAFESTDTVNDNASGASDKLQELVGKIENVVGIHIDYEDFIFDFANDYAQNMKEESGKNRTFVERP